MNEGEMVNMIQEYKDIASKVRACEQAIVTHHSLIWRSPALTDKERSEQEAALFERLGPQLTAYLFRDRLRELNARNAQRGK